MFDVRLSGVFFLRVANTPQESKLTSQASLLFEQKRSDH